ncbi:MAG: hypothetical protein PHQ86_03280 [Dehalococcoidales bacterium]|nr:hypothetical protein [Dehalococcoidales bacterium]
MLINGYKLEITWEAGCCTNWQSATLRLSEDIGQALPHLTSIIENIKYDPDLNSLYLVKDGSKHIYIYPERIYISYIKNKEEAQVVAEWTKDIFNEAYPKLAEITGSKKS